MDELLHGQRSVTAPVAATKDKQDGETEPPVVFCTEASMWEGRTIMWPAAFRMTRCPGRLYKNNILPSRVTTSCGHTTLLSALFPGAVMSLLTQDHFLCLLQLMDCTWGVLQSRNTNTTLWVRQGMTTCVAHQANQLAD